MFHGVYVDEQGTQVSKPRVTTTGIPFVVGIAPIHQLDDPASAVNVPILANTFAEAKSKLGYSEEFAKFTLCQSMFMNLSVRKVAPVIFVNVLDPSNVAHTNTITATSITITDGQGTLEQKYMLIDSNLVVKDDETTLVRGTDYVASHDENDNLVITILTGTYASVTVQGKALNPAGVTASDIIGGVNVSTGAVTGLSLINKVYPMFGINAATIIAPGFSKNPTVAAAMAGLTEGINGVFRCETVIDIDSTTYRKPSDAATMKSSIGVKDAHAYLIWPCAKVGTHIIAGSAVVAAIMQFVDYDRGAGMPFIPVSNKSAYVDSVCLEDGTEVLLTPEEGNILNDKGIATFVRAEGIKVWGDETAAFPDTDDPKDKWWNIRRFFTWHGNNFIRTYFSKVDEPINKKLIESIIDSENIVMNGYVSSGACLAASIKLSDKNTTETLAAGKIYFEQSITPPAPAQEIRNTLSFDPEALTAALTM